MNEPEREPLQAISGPASGPAADLDQALANMTYEVLPGRFALIGFPEPPGAADLADLGQGPGQLICEDGETTLLICAERLPGLLARHGDTRVEAELVWIRFRAPMSWDVVGFLAKVTGALAVAGIPLGAVCGFSRDHIFVHSRFLQAAITCLDTLFGRHLGD